MPKCKTRSCKEQAVHTSGYCDHHHVSYERRLERNRQFKKEQKQQPRMSSKKPKKAAAAAAVVPLEKPGVPEQQQQTVEVSREQTQTLEHKHVQRDIQYDRMVREFNPDGTKAKEILERTMTREEEDTRSYEARIVDRHKTQISQQIHLQMERAAELVQNDKLYLYKQFGAWFDTHVSPYLPPKVEKLEAAQLTSFVDSKMIAADGIRYYETDHGPITALINHMLFEHIPAANLPELTAIYTYNEGYAQGLVWTTWNIPGGRYKHLSIGGVAVPLLALQRYSKDSPKIATQLLEYEANEIANEEMVYDVQVHKLNRFAMQVKGSIRE
jgi:hypothetical protein